MDGFCDEHLISTDIGAHYDGWRPSEFSCYIFSCSLCIFVFNRICSSWFSIHGTESTSEPPRRASFSWHHLLCSCWFFSIEFRNHFESFSDYTEIVFLVITQLPVIVFYTPCPTYLMEGYTCQCCTLLYATHWFQSNPIVIEIEALWTRIYFVFLAILGTEWFITTLNCFWMQRESQLFCNCKWKWTRNYLT